MHQSGLPPIRLSTEADIPDLYRVWRASVDATHDFISADDLDFYDGLFRSLYLAQVRPWLALAADGRPAGLMGLTGPKIDALFVDPAFHRQGIGRHLIAHALTLHRQLMVDVNEANSGAIAFYINQGFRTYGRSALDHCGKPYPLLHMARL